VQWPSIQTAKKATCKISAMARVISTCRGHAWTMLTSLSSVCLPPSTAFRIGTASATPAANAAREIMTVTGF
jgi:hypothetical protein